MGAQISTEVRARLESSTLEELLCNDEFVEELEQKLVGLESESQKNLEKLLKQCKSPKSSGKRIPNGEAARLRPLWEIRPEDVAIPLDIASDFKEWKLDYTKFLDRESSSRHHTLSSPSEHYYYTRNVQASLASDRILRRFLTTIYYDLVSKHSQSDRNSITKTGVDFVSAVICNTGEFDSDTVKENVSNWAKEGGKYRSLADALDGLGCYFFFPTELSEWIWLKYLTQEYHQKAITLLRNHGIIEKAKEQGAQDLAMQIEQSLRAPFDESVSLTVQVRQQVVPGTAMALAQGGDIPPSQPPADSHLQTLEAFVSASASHSSTVDASPALEIISPSSAAGRWSEYNSQQRLEEPIESSQSRNGIGTNEIMDVDSTSSSRAMESFGGLSRNTIPRLAANGLIKVQWPSAVRVPSSGNLEHELFDFYINSICRGRTVLKANAYVNEFLPILYSKGRSINPVLALSASYRKEYFVEGSSTRNQIEYAEYRYSMETAKEVREAITRGDVGASTAVAAALLSHHATLNPSLHPCCWTKYLYPMLDPDGADIEANLAMASVAILAMTALPLNGERSFQYINYNWIRHGEAEQLTKVNSTLGLSRMMLYFIYSITQEAKNPNELSAQRLLLEIESSPQWVEESEDDMPRYIALGTAETYRLGTRLYCLARLYGYTPDHPVIKQTCGSLLRWLYELPIEGPWYSSIHPAWCFVVACICARAEENYCTLINCLDRIAGDNKSNVDDVCSLVRRTRHWQCQEWANRDTGGCDPGWWERMAGDVNGDSVICLA